MVLIQSVLICSLSLLANVQASPAAITTPQSPWDGKATWSNNQSPAASTYSIVLWNVQNKVKTTIGSASSQATSFQYANLDSIGQGVYQFLVCELQICSYNGNFGIKQADTTFRKIVATAPAQEAKSASSGQASGTTNVVALGQAPDGFVDQADNLPLGNSESGTNEIASTNSPALSGGAIAGIVIGILVLVAGGVLAIFRVRRRRAPEHPYNNPRESRANRI